MRKIDFEPPELSLVRWLHAIQPEPIKKGFLFIE
jgi:hypothetical protein